MKILFVIDTLQGSGAERSLVEIAKNLINFTPVFAHIYNGDMLKDNLTTAGIKVYSLNVPGPRNFNVAAKKLEEIYKAEKPDLIHSTLFRSDSITRKLKSKYKIPLINSYVNNSYNPLRFKSLGFGMNIKLRVVQFYDTITSGKVDFFISNSETIKLAKAKSTGVSLKRVKVIYRGRDINKFQNINEVDIKTVLKELNLENKRILLNVSRLIERKGQMDLVNAMPQVIKQHPNTVLLIAGHGIFEKALKTRINELNLQDNIKILGRRADIPVLLRIAEVFVFPTYFEGLPGALIEAMMSEKIIVCSNIPENLECVSNETATIFNRGDVIDLANKINETLQSPLNYLEKTQKALTVAIEKFEIENIVKQYESTYNELIIKLKK